jgi:hypothetical protein
MADSRFGRTYIVALITLGGCSSGGVVEVGPDTYAASASYGSLTGSWDRAQREATQAGAEYCARKGKVFSVLKEERSGVLGWTPQESRVTFTCSPDLAVRLEEINKECLASYRVPELHPIKDKVELVRQAWAEPVPFDIAANDTFASEGERPAIAKWAALRNECIALMSRATAVPPSIDGLQRTQLEQARSFGQVAAAKVGELIVLLYQQKLTYGEFAKKRFDIGRDAADAERRYRQSVQIADRAMQMEQLRLLEQNFQANMAAWTSYVQSVNARRPLNVHLDGTLTIERK